MIDLLLSALISVSNLEGQAPRLPPLGETGKSLTLGGTAPFAILSANGAFGEPAEVFSLYLYWDRPYAAAGRRRGFAVAKQALGTEGEPMWATSHECPDLERAIIKMEDISPPSLNVPGHGRHEDIPNTVKDGVTYTLWSKWPRWDGNSYTAGYEISFSANRGNPLGTWAEALRTSLSSCWTSVQPEAAT